MNESGVLGAFASHAFLRGLSDHQRMRLASGVRPFTAAGGELLARDGQPAKAFYLIQSGHVEIGSRDGGGRFVPVQTVGPGEVVGWSWLLPPHRWQFECRAVDSVQGLAFDAEWLREQCERDHELGDHLLRHLLAVVAGRLTALRLAAARQEVLAHPPAQKAMKAQGKSVQSRERDNRPEATAV